MFDQYEATILLGASVKTTMAVQHKALQKALGAKATLALSGDTIEIKYSDFSFHIALVTDKVLLDQKRVMAQYFGTQRGDIDKIEQATSFFDISSIGNDPRKHYMADYTMMMNTLRQVGEHWALKPDGYMD